MSNMDQGDTISITFSTPTFRMAPRADPNIDISKPSEAALTTP